MNKHELDMVALLLDLKKNYNVTGVKAEFEAEGTRIEEAMRLKDVASQAGLTLNIKTGGCEAIKDMLDANSLGVQRIIAPMVETPYALQKFIRAAQLVYGEGFGNVELFVNIETITAYHNFSAMLALPEIKYLSGIVIGRVDFVGSLGLSRDLVNGEEIFGYCKILCAQAKEKNLKVVIGGGVSVDSLPFFRKIAAGHLDQFETRKIIFTCPGALQNPEMAFIKAVKFELMWLKNKRDFYSAIAKEDEARINMMENRYRDSLNKIKLTEISGKLVEIESEYS